MVNSPDFSQLSQFVHYAQKRFDLSLLAGQFTDARPRPEIPSRSVWLSLILGEVIHVPSLLQLQEETKVRQWQQWVGYRHPISHDTFGYVGERLDPDSNEARLLRPAKSTACWWSVWTPTKSFAATAALAATA